MEQIWTTWASDKITEYGPEPVPYLGSDDETERRLAKWVTSIKNKFRRNTLSVEDIERISMLPGWSWGRKSDEEFGKKAHKWARYFERHGRIPGEDEKHLARWATRVCKLKESNKLSPDQVSLLDNIPGWKWKTTHATTSFKQRVEDWNGYVNKYQTVPVNGELHKWRMRMLKEQSSGKLPLDKFEQLSVLPGWAWETEEDRHVRTGRKWSAWVSSNQGTFPSPDSSTNPVERELGEWACTAKDAYYQGQIGHDLLQALLKLPHWKAFIEI